MNITANKIARRMYSFRNNTAARIRLMRMSSMIDWISMHRERRNRRGLLWRVGFMRARLPGVPLRNYYNNNNNMARIRPLPLPVLKLHVHSNNLSNMNRKPIRMMNTAMRKTTTITTLNIAKQSFPLILPIPPA